MQNTDIKTSQNSRIWYRHILVVELIRYCSSFDDFILHFPLNYIYDCLTSKIILNCWFSILSKCCFITQYFIYALIIARTIHEITCIIFIFKNKILYSRDQMRWSYSQYSGMTSPSKIHRPQQMKMRMYFPTHNQKQKLQQLKNEKKMQKLVILF